MMEEVRRWRKLAYEASKRLTPEERRKEAEMLEAKYGLKLKKNNHESAE
jgi:hypothetical protein